MQSPVIIAGRIDICHGNGEGEATFCSVRGNSIGLILGRILQTCQRALDLPGESDQRLLLQDFQSLILPFPFRQNLLSPKARAAR
jgi:hypothetical protein